MKHILLKAIALGAVVTLIAPIANADTNKALDAWKAFAAASGNPGHAKWLAEISKPEAIELAKAWTELRGYDAYDLMEKANLPADLKPGLKITKANASQYPWLKDYMPKSMYDHLTSSDWGTIGEITIVPTNNYYMMRSSLESTKNLKAKPSIDDKGALVNPDGSFFLINDETASAIPFLDPKDGMQLNWSYVAHAVNADDLYFRPIKMGACTGGAGAKLDQYYEADLWWKKFHGRTSDPVGSVEGKDEFIEGGSIFFLEPFDIRGLAGVRQRYAAGGVDDDFNVFIPSLRRTRVLTGSDAQDPIASGLALTWDDWRAYWAKTDTAAFDYKLTGEGFILALPETGYSYDPYKLSEDKCHLTSMEVELRPVWILEITDKTGKYQYQKRTTWVDKENYYMQYHYTTDPRGNALRYWDDVRSFRPDVGEASWRFVWLGNDNSKRANFLEMEPVWENREAVVGSDKFDVDQLRDYQ
jgi:hypothetical protein